MASYRFGQHTYSTDDSRWQDILAKAYEQKVRPACACVSGVDAQMYIARTNGRFLIKRMPGTGQRHALACDSYEAPEILSGVGEVMGTAIVEDIDSGNTTLKLGFALSRIPGRAPPEASDEPIDSVKSESSKLSLLSTLHYLWSETHFHRWSPKMEGKRSWTLVRHYLLAAAHKILIKNKVLSDLLYCPEHWSINAKDRIAESRRLLFQKVAGANHGKRSLLMLIGEVKSFSPSRFGIELKIKHADIGFQMKEAVYQKLQKHFADTFALWEAHADEGAHLITIFTFGVNTALTPEVEEISLMLTTPSWIPVEGASDWVLVQKALEQKRYFVKGLRFNLSAKKPLASMVLTDVEKACALFIQPANPPEFYSTELHELLSKDSMEYWIWDSAQAMPTLPAPTYKRNPSTLESHDV